MTTTTMSPELKYADKIGKLLQQAENPGCTEAEAAAFMEKAAQLMSAYAIDEAMVAQARGLTTDVLEQDEFDYTGIYQYGSVRVGTAVANHFGLKCVTSLDRAARDGKPKHSRLYVVGFRSDIERTRLLDTSLQLQCAHAHAQWWKANKQDFAWMDRGLTYRTRRDFVFGFAHGLNSKLAQARYEAQRDAARSEAERSKVSEAAASESVALVLVNRKERVTEYYDSVWGGRTRNVGHRYGSGARGGRDAGFSAGQNANTATTGIGGGRKSVGR